MYAQTLSCLSQEEKVTVFDKRREPEKAKPWLKSNKAAPAVKREAPIPTSMPRVCCHPTNVTFMLNACTYIHT